MVFIFIAILGCGVHRCWRCRRHVLSDLSSTSIGKYHDRMHFVYRKCFALSVKLIHGKFLSAPIKRTFWLESGHHWYSIDTNTSIHTTHVLSMLKDRLRATFDEIARISQKKIDILINAAGIFNDTDVELAFKVNVMRARMSICYFFWIALFRFLTLNFACDVQFGLIHWKMFGLEMMTRRNNQIISIQQQQPIIMNIASVMPSIAHLFGIQTCYPSDFPEQIVQNESESQMEMALVISNTLLIFIAWQLLCSKWC